jgi:hypothetical protein
MTRPDFTRAGPRVASMSDALESRSSMDEMLHLANRVIEGESRRQKLSSVAKLLRYVNHLSEAESRSDLPYRAAAHCDVVRYVRRGRRARRRCNASTDSATGDSCVRRDAADRTGRSMSAQGYARAQSRPLPPYGREITRCGAA